MSSQEHQKLEKVGQGSAEGDQRNVDHDSPIQKLVSAYRFIAIYHRGDETNDSDPYINHVIEVTHILASAGVTDVDVLCAGLFHDIKDVDIDMITDFGDKVKSIVKDYSFGKELHGSQRKQYQLENISDMSNDIKLIKLADILTMLRDNSGTYDESDEAQRGHVLWEYLMCKSIEGVNEYLDQQLAIIFTALELDKLSSEEVMSRLVEYYTYMDNK